MASVKKFTLPSGETRWRVRYYDPKGDQKERRFRRKVHADRFARQMEVDRDRGDYIDPRLARQTYATWADGWIETLGGKKPKTRASYGEVLGSLVKPAFGRMQLRSIRPSRIRKWLGDLKESGLSPSRQRQAFWVLSGSLRAAVDEGILRRNPADQVRGDVPRARTLRKPVYLTVDEVETLAEAVGPRWSPLVLLLSYTGLRWGEAAALRRRRCDLENGQIVVAEAASEVGGEVQFHTPKSDRERTVPVPASIAGVLQGHLDGMDDDSPDALVFVGKRGGAVRSSNFRNRAWKPAIRSVDLGGREPTLHDLRHTAASLMIAEGASMEMVREQLGHSSLAVTQRYAHLYPGVLEQVAHRLDRRRRVWAQGRNEGSDDLSEAA
jgi:integrase